MLAVLLAKPEVATVVGVYFCTNLHMPQWPRGDAAAYDPGLRIQRNHTPSL